MAMYESYTVLIISPILQNSFSNPRFVYIETRNKSIVTVDILVLICYYYSRGDQSMEIDIKTIVSADDLTINSDVVLDRLSEQPELVVFDNNQPKFALLSLEKYFLLKQNESIKPIYVQTETRKIGKLAQDVFKRLLCSNSFPESEIRNLCDPGYSAETFGLSYPVLKLYDPRIPFDEQKRDANGYNRFYNYPLPCVDGRSYLLSSQWVEAYHRKKFDKWCLQWAVEVEDKHEGS